MCVSAKSMSSPCTSRQIYWEAIAEVDKSKLLGVIIDNKLIWKIIYHLKVDR